MDLLELRTTFAALVDERVDDHVVVDVRNITPPCVLIGLPAVDWSMATITLPVHVIAPAGTADDVDWMLATMAAICAGPLDGTFRPSDASPGSYSVALDRLFPAYEITYRIPAPELATYCLGTQPSTQELIHG